MSGRSTDRTIRYPGVLSAIAAFFLCAAGIAEEASRSGGDAPSSIPEFRRIFVPADEPDSWPTGGSRYLPIDEEEFAKLLQPATASGKAAPGEFAPLIRTAKYQARLDDSANLIGVASLDIQHGGTKPAFVRLHPWSPAISSARWQPAGAKGHPEPASGTPAVIGNLPDGALAVLVPATGTLVLEWSLIGNRGATGTISFPFAIGSTASNRMELDAPSEFVPELDQSLIVEASPKQGRRHWSINLGGRTGGELRLIGRSSQEHRDRLALLSQDDAYQITRRGLDCSTRMRIVAPGDSLSSIELELDPGLEFTGAQRGDQKLPWTVGPGKLEEVRRVRIELAEPITGKRELLRLTSVAAIPLGKLHPLPRLRAANLYWQEGSVTLTCEPPVVLNRVEAVGSRQPLGATDGESTAGDAMRLQCLSANDAIRIDAGFPQTRWSVNEGSRVEFLNGEMVSSSVADYTLSGPDTRQLSCQVNPGWQIDTVESELPASIREWDVVETSTGRELLVRLNAVEDSADTVRLKVMGRKPYLLHESAAALDLAMLKFDEATTQSRKLLLQTPDAFEVQSRGLEAARAIDLKTVLPGDPLYADPMPSGIAFALDADAERLAVTMVPRRPQFSADIRIDALVEGNSVMESCEIVCAPSGAALDRLLVHTSQATDHLSWQWSGDSALGTISVRKLSPDEQLSAGAGNLGNAWELSWRLPQRERVALRGTRRSTFAATAPVSLVSAPEAASQTGRLRIAVEDSSEIEIDNRRLLAMPSEIAPPGAIQRIRGTYRFDPNRHSLLSEPAILISRPETPKSGGKAWVSELELDTRLVSGAVAHNLAFFHIRTTGQPSATVTMPDETSVDSVIVNGMPMDTAAAANRQKSFQVRFPRDAAQVSVAISFTSPQPLPRLVGQFAPAFPKIDLKVLSKRWRLWMPVNYDAPTDSSLAHRYSARTLSWSERLFGPLGRRHTAATRNPFRADFWSQFHTGDELGRGNLAIANEALATLGATGNSDRTATWGAALLTLGGNKTTRLLVSRKSLAEVGISAESRLIDSDSNDRLQRGIDRLRAAGLSLLVRENQVLVASLPLVSLNRQTLLRLNDLPAFSIGDGPLADDLEQPDRLPGDFLTPQAWRLLGNADPAHLNRFVDSTSSPLDGTLVEFSGTNPQLMAVSVLHQPATFVASAAIALLTFSLGLFRRFARSRYWPLFVALSFSFALFAPVAWTSLTAAVFAGSGVAWLLLTIETRRETARASTVTSVTRESTITQMGVSANSFLAVLIGAAAVAIAQNAEPPAEPPTPTASVETNRPVPEIVRVLVPIDRTQRSVGKNVYVPEPFFATLLSVAENVRESPRGWMFTESRYRAAVTGDLFQRDERKLEIQAKFVVRVFEADTEILVPLGNDSTHLVDDSVLLDGRLANIEPGRANPLRLVIAQPGQHSIEMLLKTPIRVLGTQAGVDLTIPRIANSELELTGADALRVEVPDALLKSVPTDGHVQKRLTIGNLERLAIRWPDIVADHAAEQGRIDELYWAHVLPGAITMDARLTLRPAGKAVNGLQIQVDPSMVLLDPQPEVRVTATHPASGNRQLIDLALPTPAAQDQTIRLRFVVPGVSGIGNLRLPTCEVTGSEVKQRWMAISVDPALSFSSDAGENAMAMKVAEFARAWGQRAEEPQLAYRLTRASQPVSLSTEPKSRSATAESSLNLTVGPTGADIVWTASVSAVESEFQWQVATPPTLLVSDVTITQQDGTEVPLRWSHKRDAAVIDATASRPVRGEYRVTVKGRIPHNNQDRLPIPTIELTNISSAKQSLLVYQHRYVEATVSPDSHWEASDMPESAVFSRQGDRLIGAWTTFRPAAKAEILVKPNEVRGAATQVVVLNRVDDYWTVEINCQIDVQQGAVDGFILDVPVRWTSLKLAPDQAMATLETTSLADDRFQRITVRPRDLIRNEGQIRILGEIHSDKALSVRLPKLYLDGISVGTYLLLPRALQRQGFHWELSQLAADDVPTAAMKSVTDPRSFLSYRVVGERASASLRDAGVGSEVPALLHVEHQFQWSMDGFYWGKSTLVLDKSSRSSIDILLPSAMSLLHCKVAGMPTAIEPVSSRRARISLPVKGTPQWIELIVAGTMVQLPRPGSTLAWEAPRIDGTKAAKTCWIVLSPSQAEFAVEALPMNRQNLLISRLSAADQMLQADELLTQEKPARAFADREIDRGLSELELLIADQRLPIATLATLSNSNPWLIPLRKSRADEIRPQHSGWKSPFVQENVYEAITSGGDGKLSLDSMHSPRSDLLSRVMAALTAICLGAIGAVTISETRRRQLPPVVAGVVAAAILWFTVSSLLLPTFVLILTVLWIMAPRRP